MNNIIFARASVAGRLAGAAVAAALFLGAPVLATLTYAPVAVADGFCPLGLPNDCDRDLLNDNEEKYVGTNPWIEDTDGDGYGDGEEVKMWGTDPLDSTNRVKPEFDLGPL